MFDELKKKLIEFSEHLAKAKVDEGLTQEDKIKVRSLRGGVNTSGSSLTGARAKVGTENQVGVHAPFVPKTGQSMAGASLSTFKPKETGFKKLQEKKAFMGGVKDQHRKILEHLKSMKSPNLPKSEGPIHQQHSQAPQGQSVAGHDYRMGQKIKNQGRQDQLGFMKAAINAHKEKLSELKSMPKPNLPKSEDVSAKPPKQDKPHGAILDYKELKREFNRKNQEINRQPPKKKLPIK
jgi:hypothetical protein